MTTSEVPDFLTIDEAARILRIGRTAGYQQGRLYLDTDGREGLPVQKVGGLYRVPRAQFEERYGIRVTVIPVRHKRPGPMSKKGPRRGPAQDIPRAPRKDRRRRGDDDDAQGGLPFAG